MAGRRRINSARRDQAALFLAFGHSISEVAMATGVGERTIKRWRAEDPTFRGRVHELQVELFEQTTAQLGKSTTAAADRLHELVASENERVALAASRSVLNLSKALRETVIVERRVESLEQQLAKWEYAS